MKLSKPYLFVLLTMLVFMSSCFSRIQKRRTYRHINLAYIKANEGVPIELVGIFKTHLPNKNLPQERLFLSDNTSIIISMANQRNEASVLIEKNNRKWIRIKGTVYIDEIPDKYWIIGRTPEPYLLDVTDVALLE